METRLLVLTQGFMNHDLGDANDAEAAPRHSSKKATTGHNEPQPSSVTNSLYAYKFLARISTTSNKRAQLSSPAAHYAAHSSRRPTSPADDESGSRLTEFFEPGGGAQQAVDNAKSFSSHYSSYLRGPEMPDTRMDDDDDDIDGDPGDFIGFKDDIKELELGNDANGTSPLASSHPNQNLAPQIERNPKSPPKHKSALRSTSFAPLTPNLHPTMDDAVDADPDFFEGATKDGDGPGPHFITMSFIKDKTKIRDQLLKALATTVTILADNIPGALVHCISKDAKLPPLSSATAVNFPTSGMQARYYLFIQNSWSLQPGTRNKPKLPAPKVGKDGRQLFDKNRGYDGPDCITSIMWISADVNIKDALENLQMELEGEHLQIRWKAAQKKNTKNLMVIYGLPPGFDAKGIMRELTYGLKESEKELCDAKKSPWNKT